MRDEPDGYGCLQDIFFYNIKVLNKYSYLLLFIN